MATPRIYTVHVNPSRLHPYEAAEFVREGFNWKAFFFSGLWTLYHRLWWQAAFLLVYNFVILSLLNSGTLSHSGLWIINIGVHIAVGFEANEWIRNRLKNKGYLTSDITTGDSAIGAELRFFDRYFSAHPAASLR